MLKTHIDLFSGIGGFALAANWAGYQTEIFCERDEFCRKVLGKHWPTVPIVGDIFDFDGTQHAGADLLTAGIPCQPYSCAGKRLGAEDDRALWPEALRVIREARPRWVVIENVAGFINLALDGVLSDLEAEGYETGAVVLPACAVNAPHRRDRVWVVANSNGSGRDAQPLPVSVSSFWENNTDSKQSSQVLSHSIDQRPSCPRSHPQRQGAQQQSCDSGSEETAFMAHATKQGFSDWRSAPMERRDSFAKFERRDCNNGTIRKPLAGLGGMADGIPGNMDRHFDTEPDIPRVSKGIPNRAARLKALGNAVVVPLVYQILKAIRETEDA